MTEIEIPSASFFEKFKATDGALSCCEAIAIFNLAKLAPTSRYVELGTYKGKSAMSAAAALKDGSFDLIEPEFGKSIWGQGVVNEVVSVAPNKLNVYAIPEYSTNMIQCYEKLAYVFVDSGSHQDGLPMQEVKLLEDKMLQGGIIAFHDWNSQFVEVKEASDYLVRTGKYEYININWPTIIRYVRENELEIGNKSWHHNELEFPCFVGAVKRK